MAAINSSGSLKKTLFETAFQAKVDGLKEGHLTHAIWDSLVFSSIKEKYLSLRLISSNQTLHSDLGFPS